MTAVMYNVRAARNPSPMRTRAQAFRRRRLFAVLLSGVLFVMAARTGVALGSSTGGAAEPTPPVEYVVEPGDTLWTIASALDPDRDPREVVDALVVVRGNSPLQPGETILWQSE